MKLSKLSKLAFVMAAAVVMSGCASSTAQAPSDAGAAQETTAEETVSEDTVAEETVSEETASAAASAEGTSAENGAGQQEAAPESGSAPAQDGKEDLVTVVIPTVYEEISTQEEADAIKDKNGYESAVLEENGSLTITMSRAKYEEMIAQFKESVDSAISEITGAGGGSVIEKIEYNNDYSVFTVTVSKDEIGIADRQIADELVMYGTLYHIYTGNNTDHIQVDYVDSGSGEVIESADSGSLESAY